LLLRVLAVDDNNRIADVLENFSFEEERCIKDDHCFSLDEPQFKELDEDPSEDPRVTQLVEKASLLRVPKDLLGEFGSIYFALIGQYLRAKVLSHSCDVLRVIVNLKPSY
jgi:hypothetical protein